MLDQAAWSGGDHLDQVVEAHEQFLCNKYPSHYKKFQSLRSSNPEAAKAEAAVFALLTKLNLRPEPYDVPGTGGPDFTCHPEGRKPFVVEVTSIKMKGGDSGSLMQKLRQKIGVKEEQLSDSKYARVIVATSTQQLAGEMRLTKRAQNLLTSIARFKWPSKPGEPIVWTVDPEDPLKDSILLREEGGQLVARRKGISAILLVDLKDIECEVVGILQPQPTHAFDISNFGVVPFLRLKWPIVEGKIKMEWVIDEPREKGFWHKAVQCNQAPPSDEITQILETQLEEIERSWHETTLAELASEQGVGPIHHLEEVLGKGEGLWKDAEEFESFVQGIYQRRKEDRERGE